MSLIQYVTFRIMLPQQATVMTISALGYTAATTKTSAEEKRKVFTAANGQLDIYRSASFVVSLLHTVSTNTSVIRHWSTFTFH